MNTSGNNSNSGLPQPPLPYSTPNQSQPSNHNQISHPQSQNSTTSITNSPNQSTPAPTPFTTSQSSVDNQTITTLSSLPPLPLPQLGESHSYSQSNNYSAQPSPMQGGSNGNLNDSDQLNGFDQQFVVEYPPDQLVERALLEDSFIEHGLLAVDKNVSILGEVLNLSEGRDKLFKFGAAILKISKYAINTWYVYISFTVFIDFVLFIFLSETKMFDPTIFFPFHFDLSSKQ
jgi:hypothetical protein